MSSTYNEKLNMSNKTGVAIVGGTGYGAAELLRLCALHSEIEVVSVVSSSSSQTAVADSHPHLASFYKNSFESEINFEKLAKYTNRAVLLALPHTTAAQYVRTIEAQLNSNDCVLFDLSGDYRLQDSQVRQMHYPGVSDLEQREVVYGLTELNRDSIKQANKVSIPGCLATVVTLAALPLFRAGISVSGTICADAKTGTSGAGRSLAAAFHHPSRHDDANAYKVLSHRHEPEILQNWNAYSEQDLSLMFVPHVIPCSRGCMATVYTQLAEGTTEAAVEKAFIDAYATEPAIRIISDVPHLNRVVGTNYCDVHFVMRGSQIVCFAALDNLVKGAAGQMIQCLNIRFGFDELHGLGIPALGPC